jgi:hypothetical protein
MAEFVKNNEKGPRKPRITDPGDPPLSPMGLYAGVGCNAMTQRMSKFYHHDLKPHEVFDFSYSHLPFLHKL